MWECAYIIWILQQETVPGRGGGELRLEVVEAVDGWQLPVSSVISSGRERESIPLDMIEMKCGRMEETIIAG